MVTSSKPRSRPKHIPRRTCVGCRRSGAKRDLVRVVRTAEGRVEVDPTGKKSGRGAYLCRHAPCWEAALKRGRLDLTLRTQIRAEDKQALREFASTLALAAEA